MNISIIIISISFVWIVSEIGLARTKHSKKTDSQNRDRFSLSLLWITILVSITIGAFLGANGIGFIREKSYLISLSGLVLIVLGLIVRWIAILTLRRYFTVDVSIVSHHQIIKKGIYKFIRHPAYTGSLLSFLGLGLSFSNWLSTLVMLVPILTAFSYRIVVEEKVLLQVFGEEYANYSKTTKRLVPGIY